VSPLEIGLVKQAISKQAHILSHRSLEPTNYGQSCREVWNFCLRMLCVSVGELRCCFQVTEPLIAWTFIRGFHSICLGRGFIKQASSKHARIVHTYIPFFFGIGLTRADALRSLLAIYACRRFRRTWYRLSGAHKGS